jgi:hypothetical protein
MEMTKQDAELSPLARQLLGNSGAMKLFTQTEFDAALREAKAEIMAIAIQTTKQAIGIERQACAEMARDWNSNGSPRQGVYEAILNRMKVKDD